MSKFTVTTDGSCLGNPGPGGWAALVRTDDSEELLAGAEANTTNNRMELLAIIKGLQAVDEGSEVLVVSDSKYAIDAFRQNWVRNWQANGWKTAARKPVANQDLWQTLISLVGSRKVSWEWVKGHAGHPDNERVDQAALSAAEGLSAGFSP